MAGYPLGPDVRYDRNGWRSRLEVDDAIEAVQCRGCGAYVSREERVCGFCQTPFSASLLEAKVSE